MPETLPGMPPNNASLDAEFFSDYLPEPGCYDEVFSAPGEFRAPWRQFLSAAAGLSRTEYLRRWEQAQRLLRQNSLAYPDPSNPSAQPHPWQLDAFPLVISASEWRSLSDALRQRAHLLDLVLRDLYGQQQLVRDGVIPAELLYRHPSFLLPFCQNDPPPGQMLHFYAADLARSPDGRWWVLADRTESASGAGFALENRIALSRLLPELMRHCRVERLASYFIAAKDQFARIAPPQDRDPRVVLLSQAAGSVNYFEDAFLARYLGYTLAEAGDLAVRQNRVYMKTLAGLSPVDVLLRRPNSEHCDPLELADCATSGVAGLVHAARCGQVVVANGLGSGLVESPVFLAYLPKLCEAVLGEALKIPGVATWWCGDTDSRAFVRERLDDLVVMPAFRRRGQPAAYARRLADLNSKDVLARLEADPAAFVAQERVVRSTAPVWNSGVVQRSYIALRTFAVASPQGYRVMPGGLARVAPTLGPLELSILDGERSKDIWVLAENPVVPVSLLSAPDEQLELKRGGVDLPSRAAENFFWLGRHSVRAEALAKLLRAAARRMASETDVEQIPELPHLLRVLAEQGQIEPGYVVDEIRLQLPAIEKLLPQATLDEGPHGGLRATVTQMAHLASSVRDLMSLDSWRVIRQLDEDFRSIPGQEGFLYMLDKLDSLLMYLAALAGQIAEGMTRTVAWRFLDLGRCLERALQGSQLIQGMLAAGGAKEPSALEALLEISDSSMTYRSRYGSRYQLAAVLDLLISDETSPRSIAHQLVQTTIHVDHLPQDELQSHEPDQRLAEAVLGIVRRTDIEQVARAYEDGDSRLLTALFGDVDDAIPELSDLISHHYFFHAGPMQRLADIATKAAG